MLLVGVLTLNIIEQLLIHGTWWFIAKSGINQPTTTMASATWEKQRVAWKCRTEAEYWGGNVPADHWRNRGPWQSWCLWFLHLRGGSRKIKSSYPALAIQWTPGHLPVQQSKSLSQFKNKHKRKKEEKEQAIGEVARLVLSWGLEIAKFADLDSKLSYGSISTIITSVSLRTPSDRHSIYRGRHCHAFREDSMPPPNLSVSFCVFHPPKLPCLHPPRSCKLITPLSAGQALSISWHLPSWLHYCVCTIIQHLLASTVPSRHTAAAISPSWKAVLATTLNPTHRESSLLFSHSLAYCNEKVQGTQGQNQWWIPCTA